MESTKKYSVNEGAELHRENIRAKDLAKSQWVLINRLESEYRGKKVFGTDCQFEDERWFNGDGKSDEGRVIWDKQVPERALRILLKTVYFEWISTNRLKISTVNAKFAVLKKSIIPIIRNKNLLTGNEGDYILGLNNITDEDLLVTVDTLLVSASSEGAFVQECNELASFFEIVSHTAESTPVYDLCANFPWKKAGISVRTWAQRRANDLSRLFRTPEGFVPLRSETAMPIIERSLSLIDDYSDHFISISQTLANYDNSTKFKTRAALQALDKYGPLFRNVLTPPLVDGFTESRLRTAITRWLRDLLYLARGACVNILLLTTGLRNIDIRGLQVGCCSSSGRIDMLFYLRAYIKKTKNFVHLPVPSQTERAVRLLECIKYTGSPYLLDGEIFAADTFSVSVNHPDGKVRARVKDGSALNKMIRHFAHHFNIPFIIENSGLPYTCHCYRTTVAGWLGAASNLSVLMVRRLFGHSNDVMPTVYLRNNPAFIEEQKAERAKTATETARQMALAASKGKLAGIKGDQLELGYRNHISRYEQDKTKSHSLTDIELVTSFSELIEQRIINESVCGFMTPFGVRCMRNLSDTRQPPCAKRSHRDKVKYADKTLLDFISDIDPQNCIGISCAEAMMGPWSESIKDSLLWYAELVRHQHGDKFSDDHFRRHAEQFIQQYGPAIKKVFGIEVTKDGSVSHEKTTSRCAE